MRLWLGRPQVRERAVRLLRDLGAAEVPHVNTDLLTHLQATERILRQWGADEPLALAGLCHAAYGTDGFPIALLGLADRGRLRRVVGREAERIVYRYASCDRKAFYPQLASDRVPLFRDRFRGQDLSPSASASGMGAFADLTIANEYEIYLSGGTYDAAEVGYLSDLLSALASWGCAGAQAAAQEVRGRAEPAPPT